MEDMDPQRRDVKSIFTSALEQPVGAVAAFLDEACDGDADLRLEVSRLLSEHFNAGDFMGQPLPVHRGREASHDSPEGIPDQLVSASSRFDVRGRLGSGGFGDVYEVFDRKRKALIALKYLRRFEPEQLYRLKREFRTLTDIRHPNVIHVYELFSSGDPPFFTMELLKGQDLGQHFRDTAHGRAAGSSAQFVQLREYLLQLSRGLIALHEAQLIHRDVKPSNVFVTSSRRVVLLDFGLVKHLGTAMPASSLAIAGTPDYSSPEQLDGELTPATDWYAVGVMLFQALTGRMPFEGSILQVLSRKRDDEAPLPSTFAPGVPSDLDALCSQLLRRDPSLRPNGYEVLRALEAGASSTEKNGLTLRGSPTQLFIGREPQLVALQSAFDKAEQGATVCVHIRGSSGVGKTGVIRSFLARVRRAKPECIVLNGRCYESESAPHKGLDELVDRLTLFLRSLDSQRVQSLFPRHFILLTRLFPVLQQFQSATRGVPDIADPREQRRRAFACLRECLARISETHPLILWIDDLQWCDSDTVRLLNDLVQAMDPFGCLILLSYRDTDIDRNPVLSALDRTDRSATGGVSVVAVDMENLSYEEARNLALALLGQHPEVDDWAAAATAIARESKGNPFFVTELVRYAVAMPDRRDLSAGAFGIGHVIKRRAGLLSEPALRLLELVAVAGQPLSSEVCVRAARLGEQYLEVRSLLTSEHLLRTHISRLGEELDVYHDQVREAIAGYLSDEAMIVYHGLLAQALEESGSEDHERLSIHCEAAGNREKTIAYTMMAAAEAADALAFDRSARLLRRVLDLVGDTAPGREQIYEQLGEALSNAGRGKEAAEAFLLACDGSDRDRTLDLQRRACEQYLRSGQLDEGMVLIRRLLCDVGVWYPERRWAVLCSLLWHRWRLYLQKSRMMSPKCVGTPTALEQIKLDVSWAGAIGLSMVDVVRGADFQARYTLLALKSGEPRRLALGIAAEIALGGMDGKRSREDTERLFKSAIRLATESDSPHALALATSMKGVASWIGGDWIDCYEKNVLAASIFTEKCSGVSWELTTANTFELSALAFLGRWREHAVKFPKLIQQAQVLGDRHGAISFPLIAYTYIHSLAANRPGEAHTMISHALAAWPYRNFQMQHCDALVGEAETYLYAGEATGALDAIRRDWKRLQQSQLLQIQFYRILMIGLRARANLLAAARPPHRERERLLRAVRRDARLLMTLRPEWAVAIGNLLQAGISTIKGASSEAEAYLRTAENLFATTQMEHYLASVRLRLSQLRPALTHERELASRWMTEQGVENPLRLADMLAPGIWDDSSISTPTALPFARKMN
jgi:serine/threonine protein kinase